MSTNENDSTGLLRMQFEEDLLLRHTLKRIPPPNLTKHTNPGNGAHGSYKEKKVQQLWLGYKLHHEMRYINNWTVQQDRERPLGKYVVARINETGVPVFSRHPYRHHCRKDALTEANRLGQEHQARFGLFRCVEITGQRPVATVGEQMEVIEKIRASEFYIVKDDEEQGT